MTHLIACSKWRTIQQNLCRGDLVLIVDNNFTSRRQWRLGQVTVPIVSADGLIHSAEVATKSVSCVHPIGKLALLEAHSEEECITPEPTSQAGVFWTEL